MISWHNKLLDRYENHLVRWYGLPFSIPLLVFSILTMITIWGIFALLQKDCDNANLTEFVAFIVGVAATIALWAGAIALTVRLF